MKPHRSQRAFRLMLGASLASSISLTVSAPAAEVVKANNVDALNLTTSWSGGAVPGAGDVAVFNNTVPGAINPALGADAHWEGLKVTNPGGVITLGTGANGLYITSSGIDMSAATQDVVLSPGWLDFTGNQIWNVASGRNLRLAGSQTGAANSDVDGSGVITVTGGGVVDANQGITGSKGLASFSGKFIVQNGSTLRGLGAGAFAWGTSTAADAITLSGGTLAVGGISGTQGNWSWNQKITLTPSTTSTISAQNPDATDRTLTFTGAITGSGNLDFSKTQSGGHVFWLSNLGTTAGTRTDVMGTGSITVNGVTLQTQAGGTTNAMTHNNNIKLVNGTLYADDALQTFAGTLTLEGTGTVNARYDNKPVTVSGQIVDGASAGTLAHASQYLYITGDNNTFTGGSTFTGGRVYLTGAKGLGTGPITCDGGQLWVNPATVGGTSTISSLRTRSNVRLGNNVLFDVTSGSVLLRQTNGFWIQPSGTGTVGRLTSSSGTLNLTSTDVDWNPTTTGTLTIIDHQIQTPIVDFNGSTPLSVTKSGDGHLSLTQANTYTGGTTINGGRLQANVAGGLGSGTVTVNSGGQAFLNGGGTYSNSFTLAGTGPVQGATGYGALRFGNQTISGNIAITEGGARIGGVGTACTVTSTVTGTGPLQINSSIADSNGNLTLNGDASGYTGAVTVNQGTLTIGNAIGASSFTIASGATLANNGTISADHTHTTGVLQGTGTINGNLTLNGSTANDVLNVVPGAMHVNGDVTLSGTTTVRASGLGGTVPVLTYTGTLTGDASNLSLENAASFRPGTAFNTSIPDIITLDVTGNPVTWTNGTANNTWNTVSLNWDNAGSPDKYFQSDAVTFGDTGAGNIGLVGMLAPSSITINNSPGNDYTFTGSAGNEITGTTGIVKSGGGALSLPTTNSFTGAVTLNGGTTTIFARQVYTGGTTVNSGAILDITGGGGQTGSIRGALSVNGTGIVRLSTGDPTGWGIGADRVSVVNLTNGGTLEINNSGGNQTFSNMAITLTGGNLLRGGSANSGNFDCFNGSTSITSNASATTSVIGFGVNVGLRQANTTFTTALGTAPDGIDLRIDGSINNSPYTDFANPNLIKAGPGTLCLNNPPAIGIGTTAVYTGATTINDGTLVVGDGGTTGAIGAGAITDNAALVFNRLDDVTLANTITGTGTLEQKGAGTLTLTSGGDRSGDTIVSGGTLRAGTAAFTASTFRSESGGTLGAGTPTGIGTSTIAGLALHGGGVQSRVSTALSDKFAVTGANAFSVTAPAIITCIPSGELQTGNTIPLIDYEGTIGGGGFGALSIASPNPHYTFSLVDNTADTRVDATVTKADTLVWIGNQNDTWDVESTDNWKTQSDNQASLFYDYDSVKFTDAGSANPSVYLWGDIKPAKVEFDSTIDYELIGDGIIGTASLVKNNTGTARLNNVNTYTGATTLNGGTLELGDSGSLGATAITNNATFSINRVITSTFANVVGGTGQFVKRGTGQLTLSGSNTFTGPVSVEEGTLLVGNADALGTIDAGTTVNNGGTLSINGYTLPIGEEITISGTGSAGYALTGGGAIRGTLTLAADATIGDSAGTRLNIGSSDHPVPIKGAHTLTKKGTSNWVWYRGQAEGVESTLTHLVVDEGLFGLETNSNILSGVPIVVHANGILSAYGNLGGTLPTTQNNPITLDGGAIAAAFTGQIWSGPVTLAADSTLGAGSNESSFSLTGVISESGGSHGMLKSLPGTVTLAAANTYTGNTTVNAGTLVLASTGGLKFVIGANGVNNKVTGAGTATLNGTFTLDLTGADATNGNSWTLVDAATRTFGATFAINGFSKSGATHTKVDGGATWTFSETTGALTVSASSGYTSWIGGFGLAVGDQDPTDDPDGDGINNLMEYVLGGNPASGNTAIAPSGSKSGGDFILTFTRNDLALASGDVAIIVEYGDDLTVWGSATVPATDGTVDGVSFDITDGSPNDTVMATIPTSGAPKFFARVKTTKP